jgi:hypothetical protein
MAKTLRLKNPEPDMKVVLGEGDGERAFRVVAMTRSTEDKVGEVLDELSDDDSRGLEGIKAAAPLFDTLLVPSDGGKLPASKLIIEAYERDHVGTAAIVDLLTQIMTAGRPTREP